MYTVGICFLVQVFAVLARPQFSDVSPYAAGSRHPIQTIPHTNDKWPARPEDYSSTTYAPFVQVPTASSTSASRPAFTNAFIGQTSAANQPLSQQVNLNQNQNQQFPNRITLQLDQNGNVVGATGGSGNGGEGALVSFNNGGDGAAGASKPMQILITFQQG